MRHDIVLKQTIKSISKITSIDTGRLNGQITLEELRLDSLDIVELILRLETEFGIELLDDALSECISIEDISNMIITILNNSEKYIATKI